MPKTLSGRLSAIILAAFVIQFILFIISLFRNDGLGAILNFIKIAPYTALLGLIFGVIGTKKEIGKNKVIPIFALLISIAFAGMTLFFLFGWSFGG
ncbi:hypothetical protein LC040_06435 [Bacillus tianshenii]|nr:hypothetical protein LC040_06435 [Bacillus tianshenii]